MHPSPEMRNLCPEYLRLVLCLIPFLLHQLQQILVIVRLPLDSRLLLLDLLHGQPKQLPVGGRLTPLPLASTHICMPPNLAERRQAVVKIGPRNRRSQSLLHQERLKVRTVSPSPVRDHLGKSKRVRIGVVRIWIESWTVCPDPLPEDRELFSDTIGQAEASFRRQHNNMHGSYCQPCNNVRRRNELIGRIGPFGEREHDRVDMSPTIS